MGELNRRGVKAFAVLSFMAFTSCAIAGRGAFHLFTPPPQHAASTMQPTIRAERSHLSCGTAYLMQGRSLPCKPDGTQTDSNCDTTESNAE
nr:MAG TPA: hypothetical protein [Caudoviricetes sp.]